MKKLPNKGFKFCTWQAFSEDGKKLEHGGTEDVCFGGLYNFSGTWTNINKNPYYIIYIDKKHCAYSYEDFCLWIEFLIGCGFPCKLVVDDNEDYQVFVYLKDYKNYLHLFTGMTAIRFIYYTHKPYLIDIPEISYEIKTMFPEWDNLQCLILAHYIQNGYWDIHHSLLYEKAAKLITKDEFLQRCDLKFSECNDLCTVEVRGVTISRIHTLIKSRTKEGYQQAFDVLNKVA